MGLKDFFKKTFGKQSCAFCGKECGMMGRTKIKNDEFICNECDNKCSRHIRLGRFTADELKGHMEYMSRQNKLYLELCKNSPSKNYPLPPKEEGLEFYDDLGMFCIRKPEDERRYNRPYELIRYDQVASYEPYLEEKEPTEAGQPKEFVECGVKITLVGSERSSEEPKPGTRSHPYIKDEITVVFADKANDKESALRYVESAIIHFDVIFGVHDDRTALFSFRMSKKDQRDLKAGIAMAKTFADAAKAAKQGEAYLTEEKQAEIQNNLNAMADASTGGLAVYTRRADEAESKIS